MALSPYTTDQPIRLMPAFKSNSYEPDSNQALLTAAGPCEMAFAPLAMSGPAPFSFVCALLAPHLDH